MKAILLFSFVKWSSAPRCQSKLDWGLLGIQIFYQILNYCLQILFLVFREFKACIHYSLSNFYFSPNDSPSKTEKCFLFHLKSSFRSRDIRIFVFSSSPLFSPVSHCFRGWFIKKSQSLWCHNLFKCGLIIHFVWYLEKEIRCEIETPSIDRVLNTEHSYGKIMQEMCTKS